MAQVLGAELPCPGSGVRTWCRQDHPSAVEPDRQRTGQGRWGRGECPIADAGVAHLWRGLRCVSSPCSLGDLPCGSELGSEAPGACRGGFRRLLEGMGESPTFSCYGRGNRSPEDAFGKAPAHPWPQRLHLCHEAGAIVSRKYPRLEGSKGFPSPKAQKEEPQRSSLCCGPGMRGRVFGRRKPSR